MKPDGDGSFKKGEAFLNIFFHHRIGEFHEFFTSLCRKLYVANTILGFMSRRKIVENWCCFVEYLQWTWNGPLLSPKNSGFFSSILITLLGNSPIFSSQSMIVLGTPLQVELWAFTKTFILHLVIYVIYVISLLFNPSLPRWIKWSFPTSPPRHQVPLDRLLFGCLGHTHAQEYTTQRDYDPLQGSRLIDQLIGFNSLFSLFQWTSTLPSCLWLRQGLAQFTIIGCLMNWLVNLPLPPFPRNKALLRAYENPLVSVTKGLLNWLVFHR